MAELETHDCPVCGCACKRATVYPVDERGPHGRGIHRELACEGFEYRCEMCGQFVVTRDDEEDSLVYGDGKRKELFPMYMVSALLRERTIRNLPPAWLQFGKRDKAYVPFVDRDYPAIHIEDLLRDAPKTVPDKINRTLSNIARLSGSRGGAWVYLKNKHGPVCFSENDEESAYILESLMPEHIERDKVISKFKNTVRLTPRGWDAFHHMTSGKADPKNPAFVAMRFGDGEIEKAAQSAFFRCHIYRAIRRAGWNGKRSDSDPHSEYIMNQIIGDMRAAPFIVADFTGNNPGVYFEAGWGRGNGKTVIHVCEKDFFHNIHFDIRQINCIQYTSPDDLETQLYHHIRVAMGVGPVPWDEGDKAKS